MVYECYLDDSKDKRQEFTYVCAGFYGRKHAWKKFRIAWSEALKKEGIGYFKTSEYKTLSGEFERFKELPRPFGKEGADLVKERLIKVALSSPGIRGIGVAVPVAVHSEILAHPYGPVVFGKDVYDSAFQSVLLQGARSFREGYIEFIHDDGPDFDHLRLVYNGFANLNEETCKKMSGFRALDDKLHGPLQIADMLANSVMGNHKEQLNGRSISHVDVDFIHISDIYGYTVPYGLAVIRANIERLGLPITEDLEKIEL